MNFIGKDCFSLRAKITILISSIYLPFVCMLYIVLISYFMHDAKLQLKNNVNFLSDAISDRNLASLSFAAYDDVNKNLQIVKFAHFVDFACVYDVNHKLIAQYFNVKADYSCPKDIQSNQGFVEDKFFHFKSIKTNNRLIGSLFIQANLDKAKEDFLNSLLVVSFGLALTSFLLYFIARIFTKRITSPISKLCQTVKKITAESNYSHRVTKISNDEIGGLVDDFNAMIRKIEQQDIKLRNINQDLQFTVKRLDKANDDKKLWIQNIGHEIRTPIHGVIQFTYFGIKDIEEQKYDEATLKNYFQKIEKSGKRLCKLIETLLDFGKLEAGNTTINKSENDLRHSLNSVVLELEPQINAKKVIINIIDSPISTVAHFDEIRIYQVIHNIIVNAIKFSYTNGVIEISFAEDNISLAEKRFAAISMKIKDYGVGIPEDEKTTIFSTFTQSSRTYDGTGGTGLGLAISKEIILAHKGRIHADNNSDCKGAIFTFTIPYKLDY